MTQEKNKMTQSSISFEFPISFLVAIKIKKDDFLTDLLENRPKQYKILCPAYFFTLNFFDADQSEYILVSSKSL